MGYRKRVFEINDPESGRRSRVTYRGEDGEVRAMNWMLPQDADRAVEALRGQGLQVLGLRRVR